MGVIKTFQKYPVERLRAYLDYSCWLEEGEQLIDVQVTITPFTESTPLLVTSAYTDASQQKLMVFFGGGVDGTTYRVSFIVRTDSGQRKRDDIAIKVTTQ